MKRSLRTLSIVKKPNECTKLVAPRGHGKPVYTRRYSQNTNRAQCPRLLVATLPEQHHFQLNVLCLTVFGHVMVTYQDVAAVVGPVEHGLLLSLLAFLTGDGVGAKLLEQRVIGPPFRAGPQGLGIAEASA